MFKKMLVKKIEKNNSIKWILILPFLLQVVGVVSIIGYLSFKNGQKAINDISEQLLSEITSRVEEKLRNFTSTSVILSQLNAKAIESEEINAQDKQRLLKRFSNQLLTLPYVGLISWGTNSGAYYGAFLTEDGTLFTGFTDENNNYKDPFFDYVKTLDSSIKHPRFFDVRTREWYKIAVEKQRQTWGKTFYTVFGNNWKTLTFSYPVYKKEQIKGVLGVNLHLYQFDEFLKSLKIGKTGQVFVINRAGLIVSASNPNEPLLKDGNNSNTISHITNSKNTINRETGRFLFKKFNNNLSHINRQQQLYFNFSGEKYFVQLTPFLDEYDLDLLIAVVVPESDFMESIHANTRSTIMLCILALILATLFGILTAQWITKPILRINSAAKSLTEGNWKQKILIHRSDELGELASSFNSMAEQLEKSFAILEAKNKDLKRLDQIKDEFLANTSHELRTPLNGIIGIAESLLDGVAGTVSRTMHSNLSMIITSGRRLSNLVNDILDFSKLRHQDIQLQLSSVGVREIAEIVVTLSKPLIRNKDLQLTNKISPNLPSVYADENRLQQILYNLVGNYFVNC